MPLEQTTESKHRPGSRPRIESDKGCRARAGSEETFEQSYMCNPAGCATNHIAEWSSIEHCRADYNIIRAHFEQDQITERFGNFSPATESNRSYEIEQYVHKTFLPLFQEKKQYRLGFDVAASGQGDLCVIYIDEAKGEEMWLCALLTCRTEDWDFIATVLFYFLRYLRSLYACGDETGLGKQICWEAARYFPYIFTPVSFSSKKQDLGFALMNQLATAKKRFPSSHQDVAADYFALRKVNENGRWSFKEGPNKVNPASHCDIAWAGALATHAHTTKRVSAGGCVV